MSWGRRAGRSMTTTAPMSGVAMIAVRIGKSVTSPSRVREEEEQDGRGAERDPDRVPADEPVLEVTQAVRGSPDEVGDAVHGPVDDALVDVTVEERAERPDRPVDGLGDGVIVVVAVPDHV